MPGGQGVQCPECFTHLPPDDPCPRCGYAGHLTQPEPPAPTPRPRPPEEPPLGPLELAEAEVRGRAAIAAIRANRTQQDPWRPPIYYLDGVARCGWCPFRSAPGRDPHREGQRHRGVCPARPRVFVLAPSYRHVRAFTQVDLGGVPEDLVHPITTMADAHQVAATRWRPRDRFHIVEDHLVPPLLARHTWSALRHAGYPGPGTPDAA